MTDDELTISRQSADDASVGANPLKNKDTDDADDADDDLHHHSGAPSDEAEVFEELLTQAVPDPVNRRGYDFRDKPTDHQPLRQVRDGTVSYWPRAISNSPEDRREPGAVFAQVTIRGIRGAGVWRLGPGDNIYDIDPRWRDDRS